MKTVLLIGLVLTALKAGAQEKENKNEDYNLFISAGFHVGVWAIPLQQKISLQQIPYNVHIDKLIKNKYVLGLGYSYDRYPNSPIGYTAHSKNVSRQNLRIRFYKFLMDQEQTLSLYIGTSVGVSYWDFKATHEGYNRYWPTAQFIFGVKVKLTDTFFWQTELGGGPPYIAQTALGIKF
jgi:hypothetical protein